MELRNKVFILTGATRIGKSIASVLASKGANLAVTYLNSKEDAESIVEDSTKSSVKAIAVQADVSKGEDVKRLVSQVKNEFGHMDGLIHMAAIYQKTPWETLSESDWDKNLNIIAKSAFLLSKAVSDEFLKNEGDMKGKIILISDWSVLRSPYKDYLPYNVAKSAVVGLTLSLAKELAPSILVNCIAPGPILKPPNLSSSENEEALSRTLLNRWGGAEEIARAVEYLLEADFVTGTVLTVDGGRSIM